MKKILALLLSAACLSASAVAASIEQDIDKYILLYQGDPQLHDKASESLAWMGLSDPRLFDLLEQKVVMEAATARNNGRDKNRVALYIRALGFSGNPKYRATLEGLLQDSDYDRFAKAALANLIDYQRWNALISDRSRFNPAYSDDANRVMNMLRADDLLLNRVAGKRIYFGVKDEAVLELAASRIMATYQLRKLSDDEADGVAWMIKGLGSAGQPQYRDLLIQVSQFGSDKAMVRHAKKALSDYYR